MAPNETYRRNFGGLGPEHTDREMARFKVLPLPYEATTTYVRGTDLGPAAIIEASLNMELFDEDLRVETFRHGIATLAPFHLTHDPKEMRLAVAENTRALVRPGHVVAGLGGEHSVTVGLVDGHLAHHPALSVLVIDAHADLRDSYGDSPMNHACTSRRLVEIAPVVQVGVRSLSAEEWPLIERGDVTTLFARDIVGRDDWHETAIEALGREVYLSIDLDGLDPSVMPDVGTPEPGGLDWYDVVRFVRKLAIERRIVGFDVVELCPVTTSIVSAFTASRLVYRIMGAIALGAK
jgi:agmatinase